MKARILTWAALLLGCISSTAVFADVGAFSPVLANALSTTVITVKPAAGQIMLLQCYNPNSSQVYVQIFNVVKGSVTLGTTVPLLSVPIAATSTGGFAFSTNGILINGPISAAATTTATGNSAPSTAPDCNFGVF